MSDMEQFKAEMERRTKEIEQIIEPYLPEETGHQPAESACAPCLCRRSADCSPGMCWTA